MPVPIKSYKLTCSKCDWTRVCAPKSDALTQNDMPRVCPECGCEELVKGAVTVFEQLQAKILDQRK